ncbi:MAG TPA: hypothetical protein VEG63_00965, partial [Candidatus Acidoferrales bacterium]|nr:hypothetical protein [Candidatus Acidoferrales bacterium]
MICIVVPLDVAVIGDTNCFRNPRPRNIDYGSSRNHEKQIPRSARDDTELMPTPRRYLAPPKGMSAILRAR